MSLYLSGCDCGACCNNATCCAHAPTCDLRQAAVDIDLAEPCTSCHADAGEPCRPNCRALA